MIIKAVDYMFGGFKNNMDDPPGAQKQWTVNISFIFSRYMCKYLPLTSASEILVAFDRYVSNHSILLHSIWRSTVTRSFRNSYVHS